MTLYLADKSAYEQARHSLFVSRTLEELTLAGSLVVCEIVALELLYSARNSGDYEQRWVGLHAMPWISVDGQVTRRALEVQHELAKRGQHRRPLPDLLIAAAAELNDATVLHYDRDFDLIAQVTGQPVRWVLERGTGHGSKPQNAKTDDVQR